MSSTRIVPRELAIRDVEDAVDYYLREAGFDTAVAFIDALERAYARVSEHPAAGSPRLAHELNLPGLRCWSLMGFPFLVFYVERADHVDVWRILHAQRDLAAWIGGLDERV